MFALHTVLWFWVVVHKVWAMDHGQSPKSCQGTYKATEHTQYFQ